MLAVALHISQKFRPPILLSGARQAAFPAVRMLVPKTPVNKDGLLSRNENNVRLAGKILAVQAEAVTEPV